MAERAPTFPKPSPRPALRRPASRGGTSGGGPLPAGAAALLAAALSAGPVFAQAGDLPAGPIQRGRLIASGGGPGGAAQACFTCHGVAGEGQAASGFPRLGGQPVAYLHKQMEDYAAGRRPSDIMAPIAAALTPADRHAVSLYYAGRSARATIAAPDRPDPGLVQAGGSISARGLEGRLVQSCLNCHGPGLSGLAPDYPRLAGQHPAYVAGQLRAFKDGRRANDPAGVMRFIADRLSAAEIDALAAYAGALSPGPATRPEAATPATAPGGQP